MRRRRPINSRVRGGRRAYALALVALLSILAGIAVTLMLERQGYGRLAVKRHEQDYQSHHVLSGMKELIEFWLMIFKRPTDAYRPDAIIGFDVVTKDDVRMEVRLSDVQGSVLRSAEGAEVTYMDIAAQILGGWGMDKPIHVRTRGPAKVSVYTANEMVLQALALAIDPKCDSQAFVSAIVKRRASGHMSDNDLLTATSAANMKVEDRQVLQMLLTVEPSLWLVVVTVRDRQGTVVDRQGGLAVGSFKAALGGAGGWNMLTWGPFSTGEMAPLSPDSQ